MSNGLILVVGATGELGGAVTRRLLAKGHRVRALGRNTQKLAALQALGAEVAAGDLLDMAFVMQASVGVDQAFTSANNVMGTGASSPNKVDVAAYQNICEASRANGIGRIVNVSAQDSGGPSSPVDYFRVKNVVDAIIRECGVPWVLLAPTTFMETWVETLIGDAVRNGKPVVLFGDGSARTNFIAIDDVADFAVRILADTSIRNEVIEVGGPTICSFAQVATWIEQQLGAPRKRRHVPVPVLRAGSMLLRPFSEKGSRLMSLGYFIATRTKAFTAWEENARRFGVSPMTVEEFIARKFDNPAPRFTTTSS